MKKSNLEVLEAVNTHGINLIEEKRVDCIYSKSHAINNLEKGFYLMSK